MEGITDTMSVEDAKVMIGRLLGRIPEDQRAAFLQSQLERCGIRGSNSRSFNPPANGQRAKRTKKSPANSSRSDGCDSASPLSSSGAEPKDAHQCGFCKEMNNHVVCARKNDLKRHMGDFHHLVTEFRCPVPGCLFETESKKHFSQHIKTDGRHKQIISNNEIHAQETMICEPSIFACGFTNCSLLLEAPPGGDNGKTFRDYIEHVIKHYDEEKCPEWSYATRMRCLLRQSRMQGIAQNIDMSTLAWDFNHSTELRRELLSGNITNKEDTLRRAIALGNGNHTMENLGRRPTLAVPGPGTTRGQELGRRRQRMRKNQASANTSAQYDYEPSYQTHASGPESLATPDMTIRRSADPSPSPATYQGSVHATPASLADSLVYHGNSQGVFMGAEVNPLDPRLSYGVSAPHGFPGQRELPSFVMSNGFGLEADSNFLPQGLSNQ